LGEVPSPQLSGPYPQNPGMSQFIPDIEYLLFMGRYLPDLAQQAPFLHGFDSPQE
jgi:hypothetical protein